MNKIQFKRFIPIIVFLGLGIFLLRGLSMDPRNIPSTMIDKPVPSFQLPTLSKLDGKFSNNNFKGHVSLMNVWATWCATCQQEHMVLMDISKRYPISIYGLDYKDDPVQAQAWLHEYGNPYKLIGLDTMGKVAIDWGVYGTPETFLIDADGIVRYKHVGPIDVRVWKHEFLPLIKKYKRG